MTKDKGEKGLADEEDDIEIIDGDENEVEENQEKII